jgi:hypothetical protein
MHLYWTARSQASVVRQLDAGGVSRCAVKNRDRGGTITAICPFVVDYLWRAPA